MNTEHVHGSGLGTTEVRHIAPVQGRDFDKHDREQRKHRKGFRLSIE